jgi:hypothetical protein
MKIEFLHRDPHIVEHFSPYPAKRGVPDWYKRLSQTISTVDGNKATAKACMPFQDAMNAGYIIPNHYEHALQTRQVGEQEYHFDHITPPMGRIGYHYHEQCPMSNPRLNDAKCSFVKLELEWTIKTPPGYSCLFFDPFYRGERGFTVLPGVIDTDTYEVPPAFPLQVHSHDSFSIAPGEPIVQVIPFKREDWTMTASHDVLPQKLLYFFNASYGHARKLYRKMFHHKKRWN